MCCFGNNDYQQQILSLSLKISHLICVHVIKQTFLVQLVIPVDKQQPGLNKRSKSCVTSLYNGRHLTCA